MVPREKVREDIGPLVNLYRNLGSDSASAMVNRSISDLGVVLGGIADRMIRQDWGDIPVALTRVQSLSESLGFITLAAVSADLRGCLGCRDSTAVAAVWARLCRVAEKALVN